MEPTTQAPVKLKERLTKLSWPQSECTIYRVHEHLRNVNPMAYEPELIAIGPYHHDKDHLKMMEDHKLSYLKQLMNEIPIDLEKYEEAVGKFEPKAKKCYADRPSLDASEFKEMLVLDGCFIIQLVRKFNYAYLREQKDPIFQMNWMINSLQRDLMLFENQIPFFVLGKLYDLIFPGQRSMLCNLLWNFFRELYHEQGSTEEAWNAVAPCDIKHLLDFIHRSWSPRLFNRKELETRLRSINSATTLKEANVKFKMSKEARLFDVNFKDGVIEMAPLTIEDRTESLFRNLVAYEQYFPHNQQNFVTDYVHLLNCLVNSPKDVEVLSRNWILENWLGDEEVVAKMVNKLADSVVVHVNGSIYAEMFERVKKHCKKRRNKWMAKLRGNYFSSPWAVISVLAAIVLLLLTVTQTLFSILQVV